jgi:hypothetical protein
MLQYNKSDDLSLQLTCSDLTTVFATNMAIVMRFIDQLVTRENLKLVIGKSWLYEYCWDMTPCRLADINKLSGGICWLHDFIHWRWRQQITTKPRYQAKWCHASEDCNLWNYYRSPCHRVLRNVDTNASPCSFSFLLQSATHLSVLKETSKLTSCQQPCGNTPPPLPNFLYLSGFHFFTNSIEHECLL